MIKAGLVVWLKDSEVVWKEGKVESVDGNKVTVTDEYGNCRIVTVKTVDVDLPIKNPDILLYDNDLTKLTYLHEPAILNCLKKRFVEKHQIYTYCGNVLVAINPYRDINIYGSNVIHKYHHKEMGTLDPHVYAIADDAFKNMEMHHQNQSIIISGESGAGKTVSAKYVMRFFATVGGTNSTGRYNQHDTSDNYIDGNHIAMKFSIEEKIIASSQIMEAIGNAKTTRNDNSSRFGKYIKINFNESKAIQGATMRTYLLEKSRVVHQSENERNYHIFYQLCQRKEDAKFRQLHLRDPSYFKYLNQGNITDRLGGVDAKKVFDAFEKLAIDHDELMSIFKLFASVLHLGNVNISQIDSESCEICTNDEACAIFAELVEINIEDIRKWLCEREIIAKGEKITKAMNNSEAVYAKDALSKFIYNKLFQWIVDNINNSLMLKTNGRATDCDILEFIGILDIYGFESFKINSFEQLCINYANEKLQQQFNNHVFKLQQEDYIKEGIIWNKIEYYDNKPCIDIIEGKLGVFDVLNDECKVMSGTDQSFVEKLYATFNFTFNKHKTLRRSCSCNRLHYNCNESCDRRSSFKKPKFSNSSFLICHFAGDVEYESEGFLQKNRDDVREEHIKMLSKSRNMFARVLFKDSESTGSQKKNKPGVAKQFQDSLSNLMKSLNETSPHYIRCIKPNDRTKAFSFDAMRGVEQLRACGVMETVRVNAAGFPSKWRYEEFYERYGLLHKSNNTEEENRRKICEKILKDVSKKENYRLGKNRIFFRAGEIGLIEFARAARIEQCVTIAQTLVKRKIYRKQYKSIQSSVMKVQTAIKCYLARQCYKVLHASLILLQTWVRKCLAAKRENTAATLLQRTAKIYLMQKKYNFQLGKVITIQTWIRFTMARSNYRKVIDDSLAAEIEIKRIAKETEIKCRRRSSFFHRLWSSAEKPDRNESNEEPSIEIRKLKSQLDDAMFENQKLKTGLENTLSENRKIRVDLAEKVVINDNLITENNELRNSFKEERGGYEEIMMFNNQAKHEYQEKIESEMKEKIDSLKLKYEMQLKNIQKQFNKKYSDLKKKLQKEQAQSKRWHEEYLDGKKTISGLLEDNKFLRDKLRLEDYDEVDLLRNENNQVHGTPPLVTTIAIDSDHERFDDDNQEVFNDEYLNDMKNCRISQNSSPDTSLDEDRIIELSKRNSMMPPHLRSSYSSEWFNSSEIRESDLQQGLLNSISSAKKLHMDSNNNDVSTSENTSIVDHSKFF